MTRRRYAIVIEKGPRSYGAFVPDLPGCVAVAKTRRSVVRLIRGAIEMHLEDIRAQGRRVPRALAMTDFVDIAV
jgi:predicted RNase H-like HicB family nuclease